MPPLFPALGPAARTAPLDARWWGLRWGKRGGGETIGGASRSGMTAPTPRRWPSGATTAAPTAVVARSARTRGAHDGVTYRCLGSPAGSRWGASAGAGVWSARGALRSGTVQPVIDSAGGFAAARHRELVARVRKRRRRRQWAVTAVAISSWLVAFFLLRPLTGAEVIAAVLIMVGGLATALSANLDEMPDWVDNWKTGADGELATARQLAGLPPHWTVRHDLDRVPGVKGNVDHVIVGPGGLFSLETKSWPTHEVTVVNGRLRRFRDLTADRPSDEMGSVGQAKHNARHVFDAVKGASGLRVFATPLLVLWAEDVPEPVRVNGVWVISGPQLGAWLQDQPHELPDPVLGRVAESVAGL